MGEKWPWKILWWISKHFMCPRYLSDCVACHMSKPKSSLLHWFPFQSRLSRVGIIIVATFQDRIPSTEVEKKVHQFHTDINRLYGDKEENVGEYPKEDMQKIMPQLCGVVFMTRHMHKKDILDLKNMVYTSALKLVKVVYPAKFVVGQLVRFVVFVVAVVFVVVLFCLLSFFLMCCCCCCFWGEGHE